MIGVVLFVARRMRIGPRCTAAIATAVLIAFVVIARPSPSVLRAAVMALIALAALAAGRQRSALPALSATVLVLLVWQPRLAIDPGFTMSVLASAAIVLIAPRWVDALRARRVPAGVAEVLAVSTAAHLVTAPVIAAMSGQVSVVAIPANVLAEPAVAVTTVLGFAAAASAPVSVAVASLLAQLAGWPCRWLIWDATFFGELGGATVPWPGGLLGGGALLVVLIGGVLLSRGRGTRWAIGVAVLAFVLVDIPVRSHVTGWPPPGWFFVACDVGQGDGLVLRSGAGRAVVIDAGPEPTAINSCLDRLGVETVDLLLFTHYHLDHVGGIEGVLRARAVRAVWTGPLAAPPAGVAVVSHALRDRRLSLGAAPVGRSQRFGDVELEFLGPRVTFRNTRSDPNNSSVIVRASVAGQRVLLPGDAEIEAQQDLLDEHLDLRADVLKVPHHGSAYSDPAFLAAVRARVAVLSAGRHNDYGLPSPTLLSEMARLDVPTWRTDDDGDVAFTSDSSGVRVALRGVNQNAQGIGPARRQPSIIVAKPSSALGWRAGHIRSGQTDRLVVASSRGEFARERIGGCGRGPPGRSDVGGA
ncbi:MAG: ComEC/Rec2 family competence protein [Actinobacteria bacterium]|nr:ComEC/Rec2 family competence protein [Actinomycetota bacterium]